MPAHAGQENSLAFLADNGSITGAVAHRRVPIEALQLADSPRLDGIDISHAEALAQVDDELPPILVQRSSMRIVDGMHRLAAARFRGQHEIEVQFIDCSEDDIFLVSVYANIRHGLPLTLADRRAAAAKIILLRPEASDRWIAQLTGLADKTVGSIRRDSALPCGQSRRLGRDGRVRPLDATESRRVAEALILSNPDASLRQIAHEAGISLGTARDVREKMRQGIDPVQSKKQLRTASKEARAELIDYELSLKRLRQDPSIRYTDSGRQFLRWFCPPRIINRSDWQPIAELIPSHCTFDVIRIARSCARVWSEFADYLDDRNRTTGLTKGA
jgi:ParB-like chromosome segregation protein Spo0J